MRSFTWPPVALARTQTVDVYVPATVRATQFGESFSVHACAVVSVLWRSAAQPSVWPRATRVSPQPASGAQPDRSVSNVALVTRLPATPAVTTVPAVVTWPAVSVADTSSGYVPGAAYVWRA